ncbi:MAG: hypothetical protein A2293_16995 [Elusimicrobia bacterium RIFOXYB2_FULL_49_7]|nr:MAG: hypothetical protein A2293_16995 [Elusimicrobia bacterium RIFOXYB2_FULL_49_7]
MPFGGGGMGGGFREGGGGPGGRGGGSPEGRMRGGSARNGQASSARNLTNDHIRQLLTFGDELQLTEAQVTSLKEIRSEAMKEAAAKASALTAPQQKLGELLGKEVPDFSAARTTMSEISQLIAGLQMLAIDSYEKAYNVLTGEQKEQLIVIRARLQEEEKTSMRPPMQGGPNSIPEGMGHQ